MISITQLFRMKLKILFIGFIFILKYQPVSAILVIDSTDTAFSGFVDQEITKMKEGKRGIPCQKLISDLELSTSTTTISQLTQDENTWHPNDLKGTRSHIVALDTKIRGAERNTPTSAQIYIHLSRIDPQSQLFKLGTFVQLLALSMDLNQGKFSKDTRTREIRSMFFRNAWRHSLGYKPYPSSNDIPTTEFQRSFKLGLITHENSIYFPIVNPERFEFVMPDQSNQP